jgi:hypothetical protein
VKKLIKQAIKLSAVFNFLVACAGVQLPNTDVCIVNAPNSNRKCYNLSRDYDQNGELKPSAVPQYRANAQIEDLNKATLLDSPTGFEDGLAALKTYIQELKKENQSCKH